MCIRDRHESIVDELMPRLSAKLSESHVEIRGDERVQKATKDAVAATEKDWGTEYLDYIISAKTVSDIDEAITHINKYNTGHSEACLLYTSSLFGGHGFDIDYIVAELCGGGLMLGAFFMATDYVTSPITPKGQILYGILLGILTGLFRIFGAVSYTHLDVYKRQGFRGKGRNRNP